MYRITKMNNTYYAVDMGDDWHDNMDEIDNIEILTEEGEPVILVEEIRDLSRLGIDPRLVKYVDDYEDDLENDDLNEDEDDEDDKY